MTDSEHKICAKCHRSLPLSDFRKGWKDNLRTECIYCGRERTAQFRQTEAGRISRERYNKSPQKKAQQRAYFSGDIGKARKAKYNYIRRMAEASTEATLTAEEWESIKKQYKYCFFIVGKRNH